MKLFCDFSSFSFGEKKFCELFFLFFQILVVFFCVCHALANGTYQAMGRVGERKCHAYPHKHD